MKKFIYILMAFALFNSCSEYQKVLKKEDIAPKFKLGEELYNSGKYAKANRLFKQIVPNYRGKPQAQKLMYLYSMTFFKMKEYYTAGYQFERFVSAYPKSEKLVEASFLGAKSQYMLSPVFSKDQAETKTAIQKMQGFINEFPGSEYSSEANQLVKELAFKLEKKAFTIAKQYNEIAPGYTKDYQAAIQSFDNFIFEFPGSILREEALFYRLDSAFHLAMDSKETKQTVNGYVHLRKERLETAKEYYTSFKAKYKDSKFLEQVDVMATQIESELKNYSTKANI